MRKLICSAMVAALLMGVGCGKKDEQQVVKTPEGDVTVTRKDGEVSSVTVTGKDGTTTFTQSGGELPKDMKVPVYPGAGAAESGSFRASQQGNEGVEHVSSVMLHTKDGLDKVKDFYQGQLKEKNPHIFEMSVPDGKMVTFAMEGEKRSTTVVLTENRQQGGTDIQIVSVKN